MLKYFGTRLKVQHFSILFKKEQYLCSTSFTADEQQQILQKLNEADENQLKRYSLSKKCIRNLDVWRKKNGKIISMHELIDIDGLGKKTIDKLCRNILQREDNVEVKEKPSKSRGQFLTPTMTYYQSKDLTSSLGIHLYTNGLSWARIERNNNFLSDWNFFEFNLSSKKPSPIDVLQLVLEVSAEIPPSDVYIFEAPISVTPTAQQSPISVSVYVQRIQLLSMLMTLLNTSSKHNPSYQPKEKNENDPLNVVHEPKVFFLRHRLAARLFRTLIGTEKVSTATTVSNILNNQSTEKLVYTPITVNENLDFMYNKQVPIAKEVLGQALLLTMAFMDVCVYHNSSSLKIVSSNSR